MALLCREPNHLPHIWPDLVLEKDHMIYACEQYCQWCPLAAKDLKQWPTATNLRKHAKRHIAKDSKFTIQGAGKGGRQHLVIQNQFVDMQSLHNRRIQEAALRMETLNQPPTGLNLVAPDRLESDSRLGSPSTQLLTGPEPVAQENLPDATPALPAPAPVRDQSTTSSELFVDSTLLPAVSPSPFPHGRSDLEPVGQKGSQTPL